MKKDTTPTAADAVGSQLVRGVRPEVPTRAEVDALMKRCQRGVGGRDALDEAHSIMADCYGTLGALMTELERRFGIGGDLIAARRERDELHALVQRVAKYPASVDCAGTLLRADVLRAAGPPENWRA